MWTSITTNAAQITAVTGTIYTILTGLVVVFMWRSTRQMRASIEQTKAAELSRARPYIVPSLESKRVGFYSFRVKNVGQSSALNLKIKCEPEIKPVLATGSVIEYGRIAERIGMLHEKVPYLAPQQVLEELVGHFSGIKATYPELSFRFDLEYDGIGGPYSEKLELSLKPTEGAQHLMEYDLGDELHEINQTLGRIRDKIGDLAKERDH